MNSATNSECKTGLKVEASVASVPRSKWHSLSNGCLLLNMAQEQTVQAWPEVRGTLRYVSFVFFLISVLLSET